MNNQKIKFSKKKDKKKQKWAHTRTYTRHGQSVNEAKIGKERKNETHNLTQKFGRETERGKCFGPIFFVLDMNRKYF